MKLRNFLQSCVCSLCICATVSFLMIFIITLTLIENLNDNIKQFTPLYMSNETTWGQIPGHLNYTFTKEIYMFDVTKLTTHPARVEMETRGPFSYEINRTFVDPVYDDAKKVVNYTMQHEYNLKEDGFISKMYEVMTEIDTINLDGGSSWYQMVKNSP